MFDLVLCTLERMTIKNYDYFPELSYKNIFAFNAYKFPNNSKLTPPKIILLFINPKNVNTDFIMWCFVGVLPLILFATKHISIKYF